MRGITSFFTTSPTESKLDNPSASHKRKSPSTPVDPADVSRKRSRVASGSVPPQVSQLSLANLDGHRFGIPWQAQSCGPDSLLETLYCLWRQVPNLFQTVDQVRIHTVSCERVIDVFVSQANMGPVILEASRLPSDLANLCGTYLCPVGPLRSLHPLLSERSRNDELGFFSSDPAFARPFYASLDNNNGNHINRLSSSMPPVRTRTQTYSHMTDNFDQVHLSIKNVVASLIQLCCHLL